MSFEQVLHPHLAAMISLHAKEFVDRQQRQLQEFCKRFSYHDQSSGDAHSTPKDVLRQFWEDARLSHALVHSTVTADDAHEALDAFGGQRLLGRRSMQAYKTQAAASKKASRKSMVHLSARKTTIRTWIKGSVLGWWCGWFGVTSRWPLEGSY